MSKQNILIQIDGDPHASAFDSIVAIDSGVDRLLPFHNVTSMEVQNIVHGAMFTRGGDDLKHTALFFGGNDVDQTNSLFRAAQKCFFGPVRVSMMADPNGSNTTAAAAVISAGRHAKIRECEVTVLAATGPVGRRIVELVFALGGKVRVCSRRKERAQQICDSVREFFPDGSYNGHPVGEMSAWETDSLDQTLASIDGTDILFAAGAAGIMLVTSAWKSVKKVPGVAIDLNAVPPVGIEGVEVVDKAETRDGVICYGAIGVGGLKMKIHKKCLAKLFEANDLVLKTQEIYDIGCSL